MKTEGTGTRLGSIDRPRGLGARGQQSPQPVRDLAGTWRQRIAREQIEDHCSQHDQRVGQRSNAQTERRVHEHDGIAQDDAQGEE